MHLPRSPYSLRETLGVLRRMFGPLPPGVPRSRALVLDPHRPPTRWIGFVGDIMPLMWREARVSPRVSDFFADCDRVVGNFEGIVSDGAWFPFLQKHTPAIFTYLARVAPPAKWVLGVANNHAPDYGDRGFEATLAAIDAAGMQHVGSAARPRVDLGGGVTVTAWTEWTNGRTSCVPTRDPGAPASPGLHVAFPHWGYEFERTPREGQRRALPAGYSAVIGHHSHVPQDLEVHGGRLVAWSLGNFLSEVRLPTMGQGALLKIGIAAGKHGAPVVVAASSQPIALHRGHRRYCAIDLL
jgi:hypothetical protein